MLFRSVVGDTVEEAKARRAHLDSLVHYDSAIGSLSIALGVDARAFDPDGPLPEIPETEASKSGRERAIALARREGLTVRQLAQRLGGYAGAALVGTPATIADTMEEWLETRACDGFNVMFPHVPAGTCGNITLNPSQARVSSHSSMVSAMVAGVPTSAAPA